ncbi:hypothetical protein A3Q56_01320 [Intoshia linei]|uniref:Major facilitator superfamily associated domain-containing protein n=1 Tax=Intoshia linei TaxID=1819745 RepID=A0A177BBF2_9BILA|nr:hypothetical protein A3Q56_01320 [Intoshia linei]
MKHDKTNNVMSIYLGILSDKFNGFRKYGKRKSVHLIGTGIVCVSFIFIFVGCLSCHNITKLGSLFFYIPIVMLFQIGWAIVQVSHLALLSDLSRNKRDSIIFNSIR